MNIVSTMVTLSIMGAAAPAILQMSIAPFEAQKRAENLGTAESAAVVFAAQYEGTSATPVATDICEPTLLAPGAWQVYCDYGEGDSLQAVTRAFRTIEDTPPGSSFAYEAPSSFSNWNCPPNDPFGVETFNDRHGGWCKPTPLTHWGNSHPIAPENWLYDLSPWFTG